MPIQRDNYYHHSFFGEYAAVAQDNFTDIADAQSVHHYIGSIHRLVGNIKIIFGNFGNLAVVHHHYSFSRDADSFGKFYNCFAEEIISVHRNDKLWFHELHHQFQIFGVGVAACVNVQKLGVVNLVNLPGDIVLEYLHASFIARNNG